jgi:hypothetical protein
MQYFLRYIEEFIPDFVGKVNSWLTHMTGAILICPHAFTAVTLLIYIISGLPPEDGKSLRSVLGPAIGKIRFLTLTPSQFADGPAESPLLTQDESFAILLNISSTSASCKRPLPEGFSNSVESRCRPSPASPEQVGIIASPAHRDTKFYCVRNILPQPHCLNTSILDCSVTFTVDRNIFVHGVQVSENINIFCLSVAIRISQCNKQQD